MGKNLGKKKFVYSWDIWDRPPTMDFKRANKYLQDVKAVLDAYAVPFFLFYGTLVGAIREQNFILWDHDVDIGIFGRHAERARQALNSLRYSGYRVSTNDLLGDRGLSFLVKKDGYSEKIDIYTLFLNENKRCYIRKHKGLLTIHKYPAKYFKNMEEIDFKGAKYKVPTPPEEFLEVLWGDWWRAHKGQFGIVKTTKIDVKEFTDEEK